MRTLVAVWTLVSGVLAQRKWIVDAAGGPGVFLDIPPALAAAAPGDRIELRGAGPYSEFTVTRDVDLEGVAPARVPRFSVHARSRRRWSSQPRAST